MNIKDKWNNATTRTKVIIIAVLVFILLGIAGSATAGSPTPGTDDPHVYGPAPYISICHDLSLTRGGKFTVYWAKHCKDAPKGTAYKTTTTTHDGGGKTPTTRPHPEKPDDKDPKGKKDKNHDPKGKNDKPKGNASANNGRGGNYDKTGHQDNGKGKGREKK